MILSLVNASSSSTFKDLGANTYDFEFPPLSSLGNYVTDTFTIGDYTVQNQVMGLSHNGSLFVNVLGIGFQLWEAGVATGKFHSYPTWLQNSVTQGHLESATAAIWLNPNEGPSDGPDSFPSGSVVFGGLDMTLFEGDLVTFPLVNATTLEVMNPGFNWIVPLTALHIKDPSKKGSREISAVAAPRGDPCLLDSGTAFNLYANETFQNIVAAYPQAVLNASTSLYEIPCDQRFNVSNSWSHTISDPRNPRVNITIVMPAAETIWTTDRLFPGGDPNTCSLAAGAFSTFLPTFVDDFRCVLGDNFMKNAYFVLDVDNSEISIAKAAKDASSHQNVVSIPKQGVRRMKDIAYRGGL